MFAFDTNATGNSSSYTLTNNGLSVVKKLNGKTWTNGHIFGTKSFSTGITYWEVTLDSLNPDGSGFVIGVANNNRGTTLFKNDVAIGLSGIAYGCTGTNHGIKTKTGDVVGVYLDLNLGFCYWFINGVKLSVHAIITPGKAYYPVIHLYYQGDGCTLQFPTTVPSINTTSVVNTQITKTGWSLDTNGTKNGQCYTLTNNNTSVVKVDGGNCWEDSMIYGSTPLSSGTSYWEIQVDSVNEDGSGFAVGISDNNTGLTQFTSDLCIGLAGTSYNLVGDDHLNYGNPGDIIGVLCDFIVGKVFFFYNGKQVNAYGILTNKTYYPCIHLYYIGDSFSVKFPSKIPIVKPISKDFTLDINGSNNASYFLSSNGGLTVKKVGGGNVWDNAMIYGTKGIKTGKCKYSVRIDSINPDGSGFMIGVASKNDGTSIFSSDLGVGMSGIVYGSLDTTTYNLKGKSGDVVMIEINFDLEEVFFWYNGIRMSLGIKIYKGEVWYPVVHLYYVGDQFTVSFDDLTPIPKVIPTVQSQSLFTIDTNWVVKCNNFALTNNNLSVTKTSGQNTWANAYVYASRGFSGGKVYYEVQIDAINKDRSGYMLGLSTSNLGTKKFRDDNGIGMGGLCYNMNSTNHTHLGKVGDVYGFSLNFDAGECVIHYNGEKTDLSFPISKGTLYYPVVHLYYVNDGFSFIFPVDSIFTSEEKGVKAPSINTFFQWNTNSTGNQSLFENLGGKVKKIGGGNTWKNAPLYGTTPLKSGSNYWEITIDSINADGSGFVIGVATNNVGSTAYSGDLAIGFAGSAYGCVETSHGKKGKAGDVIGVWLNFDTSSCRFFYNGVEIKTYGLIQSGITYYPVVHMYYVGDACHVTADLTSLMPKVDLNLFKQLTGSLNIKNDSLWNWNTIDNAIPSHSCHSTLLYKDDIYILFGDENNHITSKIFAINTINQEKKFFTPLNSPLARRHHTCVLYKDSIYVFGGNTVNGATNELFALNLESMKWTQLSSEINPQSRSYHTMTLCGDKMYLFGGVAGNDHLNDLWCFDLTAGKWSQIKPNSDALPKPRRYSTLTTWKKKLYLFAGRDDLMRFNDMWEYHTEMNIWTCVETSGEKCPNPMSAHTSVMYRQNMYTFGGNDGNNTLPNSVYRYNTATCEWRQMSTTGLVPEGRYWHIAVVDEKKGEMYIHGGMGISVPTCTFSKIKIE